MCRARVIFEYVHPDSSSIDQQCGNKKQSTHPHREKLQNCHLLNRLRGNFKIVKIYIYTYKYMYT